MSSTTRPDSSLSQVRKMRILIVEDEFIVSRDIALQLQKLGYETVGPAHSAQEATQQSRELKPDLVLMDIQLKGDVDGITAAQIIHEEEGIPIVFLTAFSAEETIERAKLAEPFGFILKPFSERELSTTIALTLSKAHIDQKLKQSEEKYRTLFENTITGIFHSELSGKIIFANQAILKLFEYPSFEEFSQQTSPSLYKYPSQREEVLTSLSKEGRLDGYEATLLSRTGKELIVLVSMTLVKNQIHGTLVDITAYKQSLKEKNRAYQELWLQKYAMDQHSVIAITDAKGKITYANDKFCSLSQYSREELLGQDHRLLNSGLHSKTFFSELYANIKMGQVWHGEIRNRAKDGSYYWLDTTIVPHLDENKQLQEIIAIRTDVTSHKKTLENLIVANTEATEFREKLVNSSKLSELGLVASGIAHEINNPLTIIMAKTGRIKRKLTEVGEASAKDVLQQLEADLASIQGTTERIAEIVDGLRMYSRNGQKDKMVMGQLKAIVQGSVAMCRERFKMHDTELRLPEIPEQSIFCRPTQISQILINLFNNAFDAVQGLNEKWVSLEIKVIDAKRIKLTVTDSGFGISQDILDKLMTPFFTTKELGKGTGLGLSISRGIAMEHQGELVYQLNDGHTSFCLEIALTEPAA